MKRRIGLGALALFVALAVAWWLVPAPAPAPAPTPVATAEAPPPERPPVPTVRPVVEAAADTDTEEPPPSVYLEGHLAVAEALGALAIRCWVGPEYDTEDLVGAFHQKVSNGWYTNVETELEGYHSVERKYYDNPDAPTERERGPQFETLFRVSWSATDRDGVVPCQVHFDVAYGELRVHVVDEQGAPVRGATVYGCGRSADSDAQGLALLEQVFAETRCSLTAYTSGASAMCRGTTTLEPWLAADEVRDVELPLDCQTMEDLLAGAEPLARPPRRPRRKGSGLSTEEELRRFRALKGRSDLGEGGQRLVDDLIEHREFLLQLEDRHEQEIADRIAWMDEIERLQAAAEAAPTQEQADALEQQWRELVSDPPMP